MELDRDRLLERTLARGAELSRQHVRRRRLARTIPSVGLVVALTVVVAVALTRPTRDGNADLAAGLPVVNTSLTPKGWVPVDYGLAQISVPSSWAFQYEPACIGPKNDTVTVGTESSYAVPCALGPPATARFAAVESGPSPAAGPMTTVKINGFTVDRRPAGSAYWVRQLRVWLLGSLRVVHTLTYSPRAVALARGPAPAVPAKWVWTTEEGLRFAVPAAWDPAKPLRPNYLGSVCAVHVIPALTAEAVVVAHGPTPVASCLDDPSGLLNSPPLPTDGLEMVRVADNARPQSPICPAIKLPLCMSSPAPGLDLLAATVANGSGENVFLVIGLAGNGMVARTVLYSIHPA